MQDRLYQDGLFHEEVVQARTKFEEGERKASGKVVRLPDASVSISLCPSIDNRAVTRAKGIDTKGGKSEIGVMRSWSIIHTKVL